MNSVQDGNEFRMKFLNRADRRAVGRMVSKGYDPEKIAHELDIISRRRKPSKLMKWVKRIWAGFYRDGYLVHIPKHMRPMLETGVVKIDRFGEHPIRVCDWQKCEKLRRNGA